MMTRSLRYRQRFLIRSTWNQQCNPNRAHRCTQNEKNIGSMSRPPATALVGGENANAGVARTDRRGSFERDLMHARQVIE